MSNLERLLNITFAIFEFARKLGKRSSCMPLGSTPNLTDRDGGIRVQCLPMVHQRSWSERLRYSVEIFFKRVQHQIYQLKEWALELSTDLLILIMHWSIRILYVELSWVKVSEHRSIPNSRLNTLIVSPFILLCMHASYPSSSAMNPSTRRRLAQETILIRYCCRLNYDFWLGADTGAGGFSLQISAE